MPFPSGVSGNINGRPPGAKGKVTNRMRELLTKLWEDDFEEVQKEIRLLKGKDKINAYIDILPYIVPRLQNTSLDIDVEKLSDQDLDQLFEMIMAKANGNE